MNWTEGSLARHSRGRERKDVLLRQKQHFAKARSGMLTKPQQTTPPRLSFVHGNSSSSRRSARPLHKRQRSPPRALGGQGSAPQRSGKAQLNSSPYFSMTEGAVERKRSHPAGEESSIEAKKQRLLMTGDWLGLEIQKPIDVQFAPARSGHSKWSRTMLGHQATKQTTGHALGSTDKNLGRSRLKALLRGTRNIRVRIGSQGTTDFRQGSSRSGGDRRERASSHVSATSSVKRSPLKPAQLEIHNGENGWERIIQDMPIRPSCSVWSGPSDHQPEASQNRQPDTAYPPIFHPVPLRRELHPILVSPSLDSDATDSVLAQVGGPRMAVPASQRDNNDTWRAFVAPSSTRTSGITQWNGQESDRGISPGISALEERNLNERSDSIANTETLSLGRQAHSVDELTAALPSETLHESRDATTRLGWDDKLKFPRAGATTRGEGDASVGQKADPPRSPREARRHDNGTGGQASLGESRNISPGPIPKALGSATDARDAKSGLVKHRIAAAEAKLHKAEIAAIPKVAEDEIWKQFLFSDSEVEEGTVLETAIREAARALHPSEGSYDGPQAEEAETVATMGTYSSEIDQRWPSSPDGSSSRRATDGSPKAASVVPGDLDSALAPEMGQAFQAAATASSISIVSTGLESSAGPSDLDSLVVHPAMSVTTTTEPNKAKFLAPRQAVETPASPKSRPKMALKATTGAVKRNSAKKRRPKAGQPRAGRADIREVPDYSGDPIEEFDDIDLIKLPPPSLFGALEME